MHKSYSSTSSAQHYFVDEAGDGVLFDRQGKVRIGTDGCSQFFIVGFTAIPQPEDLSRQLEQLRQELLSDPYFRRCPSMQTNARKTAIAFHAKDDLPEVRWQVLSLLRRQEGLRFFAVVCDKWERLEYVRQRNLQDPAYRYHPNELYDYMVRRLFKTVLHKDDEYHIYFAKRGTSDRTNALRTAIRQAQQRFQNEQGIDDVSTIHVTDSAYHELPCLQVTDYFLWTLQRLYERHEDRFIELLWPAFRLVNDVDDKRESVAGTYYTQKKPLTLAALGSRLYKKEEPGI